MDIINVFILVTIALLLVVWIFFGVANKNKQKRLRSSSGNEQFELNVTINRYARNGDNILEEAGSTNLSELITSKPIPFSTNKH